MSSDCDRQVHFQLGIDLILFQAVAMYMETSRLMASVCKMANY